MATQILMPALSPTMTEGKLAKWLKKEGDTVESGDIIAEIETDKATMEFEAVDEGTIGKILVDEGTEGVAVNQPIAILLEEGEDESAIDKAEAPAGAGGGEAKLEAPQPESPPKPAMEGAAATPAPAESAAPSKPSGGKGGGRIFASPLARRMAKDAGLDLGQIKGTGPKGRIVKADIEKAKAEGVGKAAPAAAPAKGEPVAAAPQAPGAAKAAASATPEQVAMGRPYRLEPNSGMRKTIAKRLSESKQTVPHFYLTVDLEIDELLDLRKRLNAKADGDYKLSVNDLIIKAVAAALKKVPAANATWTDEGILYWEDIDVSVAVATEGGLITPIIKKADQKGLATISNDMKDLAKRARDGKLKPEEYQGGGFSISNLGMYGIREFSAIINPPQGCILAVGSGEQRPIVKDGALTIATMMTCTLSVDHRVVDGAVGAEFLAAFKAIVQDPLSIML
ncbi:Dihydrolipoamide acetyltransferase component of pyruvate dehydrogenase complex [Caenispirillum salinarum AK4]|uniref:Acetyltransferase component of pyruvate dehydrogenase complex n=1 Tax=Caenispirillum salinarum AK4 TaxID=1238182 RepID=K9GUE3_9PROT|nr:pyruvate dehydrogenase complex dihydrolipoamide acetyltransferase [Caenispirillum salinarum]EKV28374.1 Dihydrolipoamide acetyltransferase component of pyruvate dehydrogenase complex [Caenispirillum salinarum AK4]